jgi:hypothetical protein
MKDKERKKKICYIEEHIMTDIKDNTLFINLFCFYNDFKLKMQFFIFIIKDYNIIYILNDLDDKLNTLTKDFLNNYLYQNSELDFTNNMIQINFNIKNNKQLILTEIEIFKKKLESIDINNKVLKNKIITSIELLDKTCYELKLLLNNRDI